MKRLHVTLVMALAALAFSPTMGSADEGKTVSYSLKKQGRVHFQDKAKAETAAQKTYEGVHPADIEPAAGGFEVEGKTQETSLSERIRLPRKN